MSTASALPIESVSPCSDNCSVEIHPADQHEDQHQDQHQDQLFRGVLIAAPAGLALWIGILKLAGVLFRHI